MLRKLAEASRPVVKSIAGSVRHAPRMWRWELVSRLASDLGVTAMAVQTDDGLLLSNVDDRAVLPWLARCRTFGEEIHELMAEFADILRGRGTYLDIGANLGVTTLPLAASGSVIHAFEPDPINFRMLKANLEINCPGHSVLLHQVALSDVNGTLALEINPSNPGDNRLAGSSKRAAMGEDRWKRITVEVRRLDDFFDVLPKPVVVKIDAQGAEAKIIAGGLDTLADADLLVLEWCPYLLDRVGGDPQPALTFAKGFRRARMVRPESWTQGEWQSGVEVAMCMYGALSKSSDPYLSYDVQLRRA